MKLWISIVLMLLGPAAAAETIGIAAWNIAAYSHRISPAIEANIATGLALLHADVIGLAEVANAASLAAIVARLRRDHGLRYSTRFCAHRENLNLAVLVGSGLEAGRGLVIPGTDLNNPRHRRACAVVVAAGEFDFVLVTVHLKSGRGSRRVRVAQAQALAAFVRGATLHGEGDVVLVGDYNMFPRRDAEAFAALSAAGGLRFLSAESLCDHAQRNCQPTYIDAGRLSKSLDGFAVSAGAVREYREGSFARVDLPALMGLSVAEFARRVADHLPLRAEFAVSGPDDD